MIKFKIVSKRSVFTIITLVGILAIAFVAVLFVKGYTFSPKQGKMVGTGLVSVTSVPDGASVYIDGHLTTATNTTISQLQPKAYDIKIIKEGFIPWEKQIEVKEGLVSEIKATLFPALPTIYPLTFNGAVNPTLSPDGQKLAFAVPFDSDSRSRQKGGIWVWTMTSQPISFSRGAEPHQIVASTATLDFSKATIRWSPDSKQVLATLQESGTPGEASQRNYSLSSDQQTSLSDLRDITPLVSSTLKDWDDNQKSKDEMRVLEIADTGIRKIASDSAIVSWSPDETKFIAGDLPAKKANSGVQNGQQNAQPLLKGFKVYDLVTGKDYNLPEAGDYFWLPDSRHVILANVGKIAVAEYDGSNVAEVYAGNFEGDMVFPWPDSSRLVILTSFNTPTASQPNLFGINLK